MAPRATSSIPSVTMKGGSAHRTITSPLIRPQNMPAARHAATAAGKGNPRRSRHRPSTAPDRPSTEPTERSIPAVMSTKVMATAIRIAAGIWFAMAVKFVAVRKFGLLRLKNATSRTSAALRARESISVLR